MKVSLRCLILHISVPYISRIFAIEGNAATNASHGLTFDGTTLYMSLSVTTGQKYGLMFIDRLSPNKLCCLQ